MILVDLSSVMMGTIISGDLSEPSYVKTIIINNLRLMNEKYRHTEGEMVICQDGNNNWRKQCFPHYKARRKAKRQDDPERWRNIYAFRSEFEENLLKALPYKTVKLEHAEADDVIGALVQHYREPHIIISSDGDFKQLQRYANVRQYATQRREFYKSGSPAGDLLFKIFEGDVGDGVPNILSDDDVFVAEDKRQKALTKKRIQECLDRYLAKDWGELSNNWVRNSTLIDLSKMPDQVYSDIIYAYENAEIHGSIQALNKYLRSENLNLLAESLDTFVPKIQSRATLLF